MLKDEIEIAINHPIYVPGHNGWHKEIEDKLAQIAEYKGILDVLTEFD